MLPTRSSSSTSATETTSTSFELSTSHTRVTSIKSTKREWVSVLFSELLTRVANDRTMQRGAVNVRAGSDVLVLQHTSGTGWEEELWCSYFAAGAALIQCISYYICILYMHICRSTTFLFQQFFRGVVPFQAWWQWPGPTFAPRSVKTSTGSP